LEWFSAAGEIYHRSCTAESRWTRAQDSSDGKCVGCGAQIPDEILSTARRQIDSPADPTGSSSGEQPR